MSSPFHVLITERFCTQALAKLKAHSELEVNFVTTRTPTSEEWQKANGLIIRSKTNIDEQTLKQMPHLKTIITATSGFDHIDLKATAKREISVMYCPEGNAQSAAELALTLMMSCARKTIPAHTQVNESNWQRQALMGMELHKKQLGIVGFGRVGKRLATLVSGFDMTVVIYDPYVDTDQLPPHIKSTSLIELLQQSDIVSLHVPLTKETARMINRKTLAHCTQNPILINTSRGGVVDEVDLAEALQEGLIRSAGLDVFQSEPLASDSVLLQTPTLADKLTFTPHIGATTEEAFSLSSERAAQKMISFVKHGSISDALPGSPGQIPWL